MATTLPEPVLVLLNYAERVFWTFVQTFLTYALAQSVLDWDTAQAAAAAGAAAALTVLLGIITDWKVPTDLPAGVLAMVRVLRTWLASVITLVLSTGDLSAAGWKVALVASVPAVLAAVKVLATERLSGSGTPATLPASADLLALPGSYTLGA